MGVYDITGKLISSSEGGSTVLYNATDYGISVDAEDNSPALQTLVTTVNENGGGIIFFPVGTYIFKKREDKYAIWMKSNVSIVGENLEKTILKQIGGSPFSLFYYDGSPSNPITGGTYSNFTVDAYETGKTNQVYGKAFFYKYVKNCVFEDIILQGTVATAMGIDFLDNVKINNVACVDCGRTYTGSQAGTSGIGIGTGGWENENFTITDCVCVRSGQYGIFIENQHVLGWGGKVDYSKGCVISNCIVRNGLNKGIGVRSGQNVTVIGCEVYENASDGIFVEGLVKNVKIHSCNTANNQSNGIKVNTTKESEKVIIIGNMVDENNQNGILLSPSATLTDVIVRDNTILDNTQNGISVTSDIDSLVLVGNYANRNTISLSISEKTFLDCVIENNILFGTVSNSGTFTGDTTHNELAS